MAHSAMMNGGAGAQTAYKDVVDGAICGALYRRLSHPLSQWMAPYLTANAVTLIDFAVGMLAAACLAAGFAPAGAILIQLFGVLSCADGEIARLRNETSRLGDYFDTMVDRSVEFLVLLGIVTGLARTSELDGTYATGLWLAGGIFLITTSAAKFRSTFGQDYPKRLLERGFSWITSGSDARLAIMSLGICLGWAFGSPRALLITLQLLCISVYLNLAWRLLIVRARTQADGEFKL